MPDILRPEVRRFSLVMERELRENDYKGHWRGAPMHRVLAHLAGKLVAAARELVLNIDPTVELTPNATTLSECADVANLALIVADVAGELPDMGILPGEEEIL
jgi:hypothetical protein